MTIEQPKAPVSVWDMYFDPKVFDLPPEYRTGTFKHGDPKSPEELKRLEGIKFAADGGIDIPKILTKTKDTFEFCASEIDKTLDLNDASSDILKGIIVGVTVGLIVLKVIK